MDTPTVHTNSEGIKKYLNISAITTALFISFTASAIGGAWTFFNILYRLPNVVSANARDIRELEESIPITYVRQDVYRADIGDMKDNIKKILDLHTKR